MRLKSFSTYGFKSFADKIELNFDKGITAVVGPNGSGKSNISDAIRWVLGEQSAKYLRGSKMEDVIFSGSGKRRALGVAEVTVEFDNSDHTLPLDFDNVSLTRRLFRSGDSEYAINKKSCRLKDIIDLMADTGLGKGSMSIIGQNKIDEILNSRPEDRRSLFEEAAGIAKYRLRKKDAVKRLDDTGANLTRINDIRSEVDAQVEPLAVAAEKTRQFNALSAELRECRLSALLRRLDEMEATTNRLTAANEQAQQDFAAAAAGLSSKQTEAVAIQRELDKLAESYSRLQDEIKNQETAIEKLRGKQSVLDERIAQSRKAGERLTESNAKLEKQAQEQEQRMQELAADYDEADAKRSTAKIQIERLEWERGEQVKLQDEATAKSSAAQSQFFSDMQELLSLRNELRSLEQEQEQRMRRREALKKSIDEAEQALAQLSEQYSSLLEQQSQREHEVQLLQTKAAELRASGEKLQQAVKNITAQQQDCQRQLTEAETREQTLKRLQQNYEGFGPGSRAILQAKEPWSKNLVGVVAELLTVEDRLVAAIETALGDGAQNIVTQDAQTAKEAISYLKRTRGGRATFLPLDTVQKRSLKPEEKLLAKCPGVLGYATDLISFDKKLENVVSSLIGNVLVAENLDAALEAAKAGRYRVRVVTLDGDIVNAGGSMSGGSRRHKEGFLSRGVEITQAEAKVKALRKQMLGLQEQLEEQEEALKKQSADLKQTNLSLQQEQLRSSEVKLHLEQSEQEQKRENEHLSLLLDDRSEVTQAYMNNRDKLRELREAVAAREGQDTEAKVLLEKLQKEIAKYGSAITALDNQLQDAKIALETANAKAELISGNMHNLDNDTLRLRGEIDANQKEQERLTQLIADCERQKEALAQENSAALAKLAETLGGKDEFAGQRAELLDKQAGVEQELSNLRRKSGAGENRLREAELALARHSSGCEHLEQQLTDEFQMDEQEARELDLAKWQEYALKELQGMESSITLKIAALGPINAAAIEEYEAVKERSEFLRKQYDDLCTAKENLEAVIGEINSGMTKRFKEAFAQINEYFHQCYVKLFGGGTAVLRLTEPENLLDSGIDIEVQPPGKKLQSLYLMSGGERALTVIALLFALLSYQPSPFCVLDEIDAALDDANIQRFADFLRDYASDTQFIIITHRKGTMESADIMYGVTMEESGVSKLLSVKINAKENE